MNMARRSRSALVPLVITALVMALAMAVGAGAAFADSGGMAGMSEEEMQSMPGMSGMSGDSMSAGDGMQTGDHAPAMDPGMDMGGGPVNWIVIGGFIALVVGSTLGAVATKRHLARRMASGALAGAGALDD